MGTGDEGGDARGLLGGCDFNFGGAVSECEVGVGIAIECWRKLEVDICGLE